MSRLSLRNFFSSLLENAKENEPQYILLGVIGLIGFGFYYFIWRDVEITKYENLPLRIIAMFLCLGLVLKNVWPKIIQEFLPVYWLITVLYMLPFFFSFMLLKNNFSSVWLLNSLTALFYLILLTDWSSLLFLLFLGCSLGAIAYFFTTNVIFVPQGLAGIGTLFLSVLVISEFMSRNRQRIQREKMERLRLLTLAASIAHELRTPLANLNIAIDTLNTVFPTFIDAYQKAEQANLPIKPIKSDHVKLLENKLDNMKKETRSSLTFIDMLLLNLNPKSDKSKVERFSVKKCIHDTLERYPSIRSLLEFRNKRIFMQIFQQSCEST